jgi:hypothetical protein
MSGYGGQPPAGNPNDPNPYGQDPYGQSPYGQAQGWNDPNAQQGWDTPGQQPYGYGYGPPGVSPVQSRNPGSTIAALVCNCVAVAMCCNVFAIPGIITSVIAMTRAQTNPASTRTLTVWSWVILGVAFVIQIALFGLLVYLDELDGSDPYGTGGI